MIAILLITFAIAALLVVGGIVAFVMLPVKWGIAVALLAFLLVVILISCLNSIDLSH